MFDSRIIQSGFERMSDRMSEIENASEPTFLLIRHHDFCLDCGAATDQTFESSVIPLLQRGNAVLKVLKQASIMDDAVFERFVKTTCILPVGKGLKRGRISDNERRLMKCANHILGNAMV